MIQEEIEERAYKAYTVDADVEYDKYGNSEKIDLNERRREGYIKACSKYESLPKIRGWVARDENTCLCLYPNEPYREVSAEGLGIWRDGSEYQVINGNLFPEITWESEPVEVELLIRKV